MKLIFKENVIKKIQYFCKRLPHQEWSGLLFIKKQINNEKMEYVVLNILITNIDTKSSVESKINNGIIFELYEKYPELEDSKIGFIHSHNTMEVFFSKDDTDASKIVCENSKEPSISVVINNLTDIIARMYYKCDKIEKGVITTTFINEFGNIIKSEKSINKNTKEVLYKDMEIIVPEEYVIKDEFFDNILDEYKRKKSMNHKYECYDSYDSRNEECNLFI